MTSYDIFQPLPPKKIKESTDLIAAVYDLVSVTLNDGAQLIGALAKHWQWNEKTISIGFNTMQGKRFGNSHIVDVPLSLVANIQRIPLSKASSPQVAEDDPQLAFIRELGLTGAEFARLPVQDYPNPLASVICKHNMEVITSHKLALLGYVEEALSQEAIPIEGISLEDEYLFYVDWEFFSRQVAGGVGISAGVSPPFVSASVTKDLSPALQEFVLTRLRASLAEHVRRRLSQKISGDILVQGSLLVPERTEDTEIEGEKCIVALCALS